MTREEIRAAIDARTALVATLAGEAAGEPVEGQIAVACVIRNRARHPRWWGRDIRSVCLAPAQFSCWWEDTANTDRVYALAEALHRGTPPADAGLVAHLGWIADGVIGDLVRDTTRGADHYLTAALFLSPKCPIWARGKRPVASAGAHVLLRLEVAA